MKTSQSAGQTDTRWLRSIGSEVMKKATRKLRRYRRKSNCKLAYLMRPIGLTNYHPPSNCRPTGCPSLFVLLLLLCAELQHLICTFCHHHQSDQKRRNWGFYKKEGNSLANFKSCFYTFSSFGEGGDKELTFQLILDLMIGQTLSISAWRWRVLWFLVFHSQYRSSCCPRPVGDNDKEDEAATGGSCRGNNQPEEREEYSDVKLEDFNYGGNVVVNKRDKKGEVGGIGGRC